MPHPNPCQPEDPSRDYTKCSRVKYRTHEGVVTHASRLIAGVCSRQQLRT